MIKLESSQCKTRVLQEMLHSICRIMKDTTLEETELKQNAM